MQQNALIRVRPACFGPLISSAPPPAHAAGATRLWIPSDLATAPKAWLDANAMTGADGSTVSTFTDQEGHFDATLSSGTGPVLRYAAQNSLKVVEFTAASAAQMTFSSSLMNGATQGCFFAVLKLKNDPPLNGSAGGDAAAILDAFTSDTGSNLGSHHPYSDGVFYDHFGVATRQTLGDPTPSFSSTYRLLNCEITSGGTYTNRIDATQFYQAVSQTVDFGAKTRNFAYTVGPGPVLYLNGYVAEVLILDYVPSSTERAQIEGYLAWRWGEQGNLPGGHTFAAAAPTTGASADPGAIVASSALTFSQTGTAAGAGTLAGTSTLILTPAGAETAIGALAGTSTLTFTPSGAETARGALVGTSTLLFTGTAGESASGSLTGSSTIVFAPSGTTTAKGSLVASSTLTLAASGTVAASGRLVGAGQVSFTGSATLSGSSALAQISGAGTITFSAAGNVHAIVPMAGSSALTLVASLASGELTPVWQPSATPSATPLAVSPSPSAGTFLQDDDPAPLEWSA